MKLITHIIYTITHSHILINSIWLGVYRTQSNCVSSFYRILMFLIFSRFSHFSYFHCLTSLVSDISRVLHHTFYSHHNKYSLIFDILSCLTSSLVAIQVSWYVFYWHSKSCMLYATYIKQYRIVWNIFCNETCKKASQNNINMTVMRDVWCVVCVTCCT